MIRPPSNILSYDDFFSGDPAIVQLPSSASDEQKREHEHKLEVARETGDWGPILVGGEMPTRFQMQLLRGMQHRAILDMITYRQIGGSRSLALAFRAALVSIAGYQLRFEKVTNSELGEIADVMVVDHLDRITPDIVNELGGEALRRAREVSPKSSRE